MVRLPRAFVVTAAAFGLSGCLLFTDPVNEAPVVTIDPHPDPVYRGISTWFSATVRDGDGGDIATVEWIKLDPVGEGCGFVSSSTWANQPPGAITALSTDAPFELVVDKAGVKCLCARATDRDGATGQDCRRLVVENPSAEAVITDLSGDPIATRQPKCSQILLSGESSTIPPGDTAEFDWTLVYEGEDKSAQPRLQDCPGVPPSQPGAVRCFYAGAPGLYTVTLTIVGTPAGGGSPITSQPATLSITVDPDRPACLVQSLPDLTAKLVLLARTSGLGSKYERRTFTVSAVDDDCEPFPARTDTPTVQEATFIWSVMDGTQGKTTWEVQANPTNSNSFTIDQDNFVNARPGDTIGLRVEVRDTPAQELYLLAGPVCADVTTPICCGAGGCTSAGACVRWTTWTVQFLP